MASSKRPVARTGRPRDRDQALGIKAVDNALDVLVRVAAAKEPLSLTVLAREVDMAPGKLHHYLTSLCGKGFVEQKPEDGLYELGPRALELASLALARLDEMGFVRKAVDRLSADTDCATFVYIWSANGPVLIHVRHPASALINLRVGSTGPLIDTATGAVFIAYLAEELTRPVLTDEARRSALDADNVWYAVRSHGKQIRADKVYWSNVTIIPNSSACAAPVFNMRGDLLCVIGASFYRQQIEDKVARQPLVDLISRCAAETSTRIGGHRSQT